MIINDAGDLLEATALHIEEHGWIQGDFVDISGRVCVEGALFNVQRQATIEVYYDAIRATARAIAPFNIMVVWNDTVSTSQEQAVEMLRHAAKLAREENT